MKTETIIKKQARDAMKGNMSRMIAAMGLVALVFLLLEYLEFFVLQIFNAVNLDTGEAADNQLFVYYIVVTCYGVLVLLFSPLLNGFLKTAANVAVKKACGSTDVFYYFRGAGRYFKTVLYNFLLLALYSVLSGALNFEGYTQIVFPEWYKQGLSGEPQSYWVWMIAATVCTVFIRLFIYLFFVHYPLMAYALDDDTGIFAGVFGTLGFSFKHFGQLFKLVLSFLGWFALCFFVVPALYVIPYFATSSLISAKWLFKLEKRGGEI